MDTTEVVSGHAKNMIAGTAAHFGYTLNEWVSIFSLVFIVVNTIAVLPATVRVIREFLRKRRAKR